MAKPLLYARRMHLLRFALLPLLSLAGCQSSGTSIDPDNVAQPASAKFRCAGGQTIAVENLGSKVKVTTPDGGTVELPSLPTGSRSRYSEGQTALVLNGRDALFMVTGNTPLECKR
jgi:membrane-bound inhibitor of C-type lysozyme